MDPAGERGDLTDTGRAARGRKEREGGRKKSRRQVGSPERGTDPGA